MTLQVNTRKNVIFHTHAGNGFSGSSTGNRLFEATTLNTNKGFGEAAGSFTLVLKRLPSNPDSLLDLWIDPEGVWLTIQIVANGVPFDVMLGNIDTIKEGVTRSETGARTETITITGRDHGKVFAQTEMHINVFEREGIIPQIAAYTVMHKHLQGKPHDFIRTLVREWVGNNAVGDKQWVFPSSLYGGAFLYDVLNLSTISQRTQGDLQDPTIFSPDQMGKKLWDAMQEYSNGLLNEMWTDLAPNPAGDLTSRVIDPVLGTALSVRQSVGLTPALYLRERPFPSHKHHKRKWDRLPTHTITPEDTSKVDLTKGSASHRYNFWILEGQGLASASVGSTGQVQSHNTRKGSDNRLGVPGNSPIYDVKSIERYGLRRFSQATKFLPLTNAKIAEIWYTVCAEWLQLVHDWYVVGPMERTGTITLSRAMPWIRVGHRVKLVTRTGRTIHLYVENVSHNVNYPGPGNTTLMVTRGEYDGVDLLEIAYRAYEHQNVLSSEERAAPGAHDAPSSPETVSAMEMYADDSSALRAALEAADPGLIPPTPESVSEGTTGEPDAPGENPAENRLEVDDEGNYILVGGDSQQADPAMNFDNVEDLDLGDNPASFVFTEEGDLDLGDNPLNIVFTDEELSGPSDATLEERMEMLGYERIPPQRGRRR